MIRFPCDKCEYAANLPRSLKRHMKSKHKIDKEDSGDMKKGMRRRVPKDTKESATELIQEVGYFSININYLLITKYS